MKNAKYEILNRFARKHGVVFFGSTTAAQMPLNELVQDLDSSVCFYNRSIEGLKLSDAEDYLDTCVTCIIPDRIIINLGEAELNEGADFTKLIEQYRWLLYKIHTALPSSRLIIASVPQINDSAMEFNHQLKSLSDEFGCEYLKLPDCIDSEDFSYLFAKSLKPFLCTESLSYTDIANQAVLDVLLPS